MAKRDEKRGEKTKLERAIVRNWIICGVSGALIIILGLIAKGAF